MDRGCFVPNEIPGRRLSLVVSVLFVLFPASHRRCIRVLNEYPQFSVIIFPYLFLTKEFGGDSLLKLAQEKNVGVIGLKPFGAGTTFGLKPQQIRGRVDQRAVSLVKEMLQEKRLSAVIPGVNIPEQLEVNVRGSYEKDKPRTAEDEQALRECRRNYYANLTPQYRWLHQWQHV